MEERIIRQEKIFEVPDQEREFNENLEKREITDPDPRGPYA